MVRECKFIASRVAGGGIVTVAAMRGWEMAAMK